MRTQSGGGRGTPQGRADAVDFSSGLPSRSQTRRLQKQKRKGSVKKLTLIMVLLPVGVLLGVGGGWFFSNDSPPMSTAEDSPPSSFTARAVSEDIPPEWQEEPNLKEQGISDPEKRDERQDKSQKDSSTKKNKENNTASADSNRAVSSDGIRKDSTQTRNRSSGTGGVEEVHTTSEEPKETHPNDSEPSHREDGDSPPQNDEENGLGFLFFW